MSAKSPSSTNQSIRVKRIADLKQTQELVYDDRMERRNYPKVRAQLDRRQVEDFEAILSHMAITLYKIGYDAIHRWDSNHLIFGSFVKEFALSAESFKAAAPYMDMIAPQHINRDVSIHKLAEAANLPILISDEYFGWHYPGMGIGSGAASTRDIRHTTMEFRDQVRRWPSKLPLAEEYLTYQQRAAREFLAEFHRTADRIAGRPIPLASSTALMQAKDWYPAAMIDHFTIETVLHPGLGKIPEDQVFRFKLADALDKRILVTGAPKNDWAHVRDHNLTGLVRAWIAQS